MLPYTHFRWINSRRHHVFCKQNPKSTTATNYLLPAVIDTQLIWWWILAYIGWCSITQQFVSGPFMKTLKRPSQAGLREGSVIQPSRYSSRWVAILVPPKTDRAASLWAVGDGTNWVDGELFCHPDLLNLSRIVPAADSRRHGCFLDDGRRWRSALGDNLEVASDRRGAFTVV